MSVQVMTYLEALAIYVSVKRRFNDGAAIGDAWDRAMAEDAPGLSHAPPVILSALRAPETADDDEPITVVPHPGKHLFTLKDSRPLEAEIASLRAQLKAAQDELAVQRLVLQNEEATSSEVKAQRDQARSERDALAERVKELETEREATRSLLGLAAAACHRQYKADLEIDRLATRCKQHLNETRSKEGAARARQEAQNG